jgi:hypothetical protein
MAPQLKGFPSRQAEIELFEQDAQAARRCEVFDLKNQ